MVTYPDSTGLSTFLEHTQGSKEVSLLISPEVEIADLIKELSQREFLPLKAYVDLNTPGKYFIVLDLQNAKDLYDIVCQYTTGQISVFDIKGQQSLWINPNYAETSLVVVIPREKLPEAEATGLLFRNAAGLTLQL